MCSKLQIVVPFFKTRTITTHLCCFQFASHYSTCLTFPVAWVSSTGLYPPTTSTICTLNALEDSQGITGPVFALKLFIFSLLRAPIANAREVRGSSSHILSPLVTSNCLVQRFEVVISYKGGLWCILFAGL